MSLKVALVALAVVCAAQAYAIENGQVDTRASPFDAGYLFGKIAEMLEKVRGPIKELQVTVREGIDFAFESTQRFVEGQTKIWYDNIEKEVEKAKEQGVDVSECISENHVLAEIQEKAFTDSHQCVANEDAASDAAIKKLDDLLVKAEIILKKAEEAVKECDGKPMLQALRCKAKMMVPVAGEAAKLLMKSGVVAGEIGQMTATSSIKINKCVLGVMSTQGKEADEVVSKAKKCINEKVQAGKPSLY